MFSCQLFPVVAFLLLEKEATKIIIIVLNYNSFDFEFSGGAENETNYVKYLSATESSTSVLCSISNTLSGKQRGADDPQSPLTPLNA